MAVRSVMSSDGTEDSTDDPRGTIDASRALFKFAELLNLSH
jgi:hypothetical protein